MAATVSNPDDLQSKPEITLDGPVAPAAIETEDLVVGSGRTADTSHTVVVQYVGVLGRDGQEFDSSWSRGGQPTSFPLNGVIAGFRDGIAGMAEGGRRIISMPPEAGYGAQGAPPVIGPNESLVFVVDLVRLA